MTNKDSILKTISFIEKNLKEDISLIDIANEGCYSLYHFIRLFQNITGISPAKYLGQRRLTEACKELRIDTGNISDIGYAYQFGSPESFTRAFKKHFGINPSQVRKGEQAEIMNLTPPLTREYIFQSEKARNQEPELVKLEVRYLVGIAFFIADDAKIESLGREWGELMAATHLIRDKQVPESYYQLQYWSEKQDLGGMYFFLGAEVTSIENLNPQFVVKVIPAGSYLKFIHRGLANKVGYTYRYIYNQYLPDTNYQLSLPFNFERYGENCLGPDNEKSESEIYIPINL